MARSAVLGAIVCAILLAGCGGHAAAKPTPAPSPSPTAAPTPSVYRLSGSISTRTCGEATIDVPVVVRDERGTVIGTGQTVYDQAAPPPYCVARFVVSVPQAQFYQVTIGQHAAERPYSFADLAGKGWQLDLVID